MKQEIGSELGTCTKNLVGLQSKDSPIASMDNHELVTAYKNAVRSREKSSCRTSLVASSERGTIKALESCLDGVVSIHEKELIKHMVKKS